MADTKIQLSYIDLVIAGCESGPSRRPAKVEWFRSLKDQCQVAGVSYFLKQISINNQVNHNISEWPEDLRVREFPA